MNPARLSFVDKRQVKISGVDITHGLSHKKDMDGHGPEAERSSKCLLYESMCHFSGSGIAVEVRACVPASDLMRHSPRKDVGTAR